MNRSIFFMPMFKVGVRKHCSDIYVSRAASNPLKVDYGELLNLVDPIP